MASHPAQVRTERHQREQRRTEAQALVDYFAKNHPELLDKIRTQSMEAAASKPGLSTEDVVNDAWRHLVSRLRFLKGEATVSTSARFPVRK